MKLCEGNLAIKEGECNKEKGSSSNKRKKTNWKDNASH